MLNSQVDEIKNRLDVVEVISGYIKLQKAGANFKASCPFHNEKTPSFMVSPSRQMWHCFGCGAGGDAFGFVMKMENLEFPEALKILADKAGVVLRGSDPKLRSEKNRLSEICETAAKFFEFCLHQKDFGKPVLEYLAGRGLKDETIGEFRVGFAPESWDALLRFLLSRGFKGEEMEKAGLVVKSGKAAGSRQYYDRFRSRIMFPIRDSNGRVAGFSGRIFEPEVPTRSAVGTPTSPTASSESVGAKYVNTPATPLYDKSRILYGLDKSKEEIRKKDTCFLVEGQMDLLMVWQDGIRNVCATSGTALTAEHVNILKRYSKNLILCLDMDEAGENATNRGLDLILTSLNPDLKGHIDRALAYGFEIRVFNLASGKDPADFVKNHPGELPALLASARPIMEYYFERVFGKHRADDLEGKKKIAALLLPQIKKIDNKIEQAHWLEKLAGQLAVPTGSLVEELKKIEANRDYEPRLASFNEARSRRELLAERLLALALRRPEHRALLSALETDLPGQFSAIHESLLCGGEDFSFEGFCRKLPEDSREIADYLVLKADWESELNPDLDFRSEIQKTVAELNIQKIKNDLKILEAELKLAEASKDECRVFATTQKFQELSAKLLKYE